jgi:hypothetical protein
MVSRDRPVPKLIRVLKTNSVGMPARRWGPEGNLILVELRLDRKDRGCPWHFLDEP